MPSRSRIVDIVQEFCTSKDFEQDFEEFAAEYAEVFQDSLSHSCSDGEHPLAYHDAYQEYLRRFEGKIARFIESNGGSIREFYEQCEKIIDDDENAFGSDRFFIEALLALSEYPQFVLLMQANAVKLAGTRKAARSHRK